MSSSKTKSRLDVPIWKILAIIFSVYIVTASACFNYEKSISQTTPNAIDQSVVAPLEQAGKAFAAISARVSPAVVSVYSEKSIKFQWQDMPFPFDGDLFRDFFGNQMPNFRRKGHSREYRIPQKGMGSGMLLDHRGNILTNYHVVEDVDEIKVQFANKQLSYKAKVIGKDAQTDIAIIQIQGRGFENIPTVTFGDSDTVHVGDIVLAIGAPFGLAQTVTHGIISAVGRADVGIADYEDFLQTDAPINPGSSGGPLVNTRGEVIGMNSAIATSVGQSGGVGFSIPSNMINSMLPKIIKGQTIVRGELGVVVQNLSEDLAQHFNLKNTDGVLVSQVIANSAAEKSGLKVEDVITKYDGKPVNDVRSFRNLVAATSPGTKVKIDVLREQKNVTVTATVQQQSNKSAEIFPMEKSEDDPLNRLGLSVETLTKESALRYQTKASTGVVVTDVAEGSPASLAGLQMGDVIIKSNRKKIKNVDDLIKSFSGKSSDKFLFLVDRGGSSIFISIQVN